MKKKKIDFSKEEILGQFFTKEDIARKLIELILEFKNYDRDIRILEPSFGTGSFIKVLKELCFHRIEGCEIDPELTENPKDFFDYPLSEKFDLVIGNPPFTKYNIEKSYYHRKNYQNNFAVHPNSYLIKNMLKREKEKIENVFIIKSFKHLKNENSSIGFILPISFFIKNKNKDVKIEITKRFSTIVVYQESKTWFDYSIPCCFALFINTEKFRDKIILIYEDERYVIDKVHIHDELIPKIFSNRKNGVVKNGHGTPLSDFLNNEVIKYKLSYTENNVSAKNILERISIPENENIEDYKLAVVRVGNASVGKCGLINPKKDILNGMFFVFGFKNEYNKNKEIKERLCLLINQRQDYFKNITCRVGSKSIKKTDVFDFKVKIQ